MVTYTKPQQRMKEEGGLRFSSAHKCHVTRVIVIVS